MKYKGHVEIPNLSDENDVDEIEVSTVMASTADCATSLLKGLKALNIPILTLKQLYRDVAFHYSLVDQLGSSCTTIRQAAYVLA